MPLKTMESTKRRNTPWFCLFHAGVERRFLSGGEGKEKGFSLWINTASSDMPICGNPAKRQDMHSVHNAFCCGSSEAAGHESHLLFKIFHNVAYPCPSVKRFPRCLSDFQKIFVASSLMAYLRTVVRIMCFEILPGISPHGFPPFQHGKTTL